MGSSDLGPSLAMGNRAIFSPAASAPLVDAPFAPGEWVLELSTHPEVTKNVKARAIPIHEKRNSIWSVSHPESEYRSPVAVSVRSDHSALTLPDDRRPPRPSNILQCRTCFGMSTRRPAKKVWADRFCCKCRRMVRWSGFPMAQRLDILQTLPISVICCLAGVKCARKFSPCTCEIQRSHDGVQSRVQYL